jgi:hypothetical protein
VSTRILIFEVGIDKGEGREGLMNRIDMHLITEYYRPREGTYRICIEKVEEGRRRPARCYPEQDQ